MPVLTEKPCCCFRVTQTSNTNSGWVLWYFYLWPWMGRLINQCFFCKVSKIWHNFQMLQCYGWRLDHPRANILEKRRLITVKSEETRVERSRRQMHHGFSCFFFNGFVPCLVYIREWFSLCPSLSCIHFFAHPKTAKAQVFRRLGGEVATSVIYGLLA